MDKTTKTILIVIGSVLVLCACAGVTLFATGLWSFNRFVSWVDESVSESPEVAIRVGSEIADFEIPEGYGSPHSIHFEDVTIVSYKSVNEKSHILLALKLISVSVSSMASYAFILAAFLLFQRHARTAKRMSGQETGEVVYFER